jgi:hypothetical protein
VEDDTCRQKIAKEVNHHLLDGWSIKQFDPMPGDNHIYATVFVILEKQGKNKIE